MKHFFIVGAQRSGTTWLARLLDEHPQISMAKPLYPEPKYFLTSKNSSRNANHYRKLYFDNGGVEVVFGEKSTSYIEFPHIANEIKALFPTARIIIMLRNPAERAISNYRFTKKHQLETRSIEEVFIDDKRRPNITQSTSVSPFDYLERGFYKPYIIPYRQLFGESLKVIIYEKVINHRQAVKELYKFLGVTGVYFPSAYYRHYNETYVKDENETKIKELLLAKYKESIIELERYLQEDLSVWLQGE